MAGFRVWVVSSVVFISFMIRSRVHFVSSTYSMKKSHESQSVWLQHDLYRRFFFIIDADVVVSENMLFGSAAKVFRHDTY